MNLKNIYQNKNLLFPLNDNEIKIIDDVWNFIENFSFGFIILSEYRNKLIKNIKKIYLIDDFYIFESIAEKLFWNLKSKFQITIEYDTYDIKQLDIVKERIKEDNYYRSFINKIINFDYNNNKIYYKKMEGSAYLFSKNKINYYLSKIFFNRKLYESQIQEKSFDKIDQNEHIYYQLDYCFPNINLCKPFLYEKSKRMERIYNMYYDDNCEFNWTNLFEN